MAFKVFFSFSTTANFWSHFLSFTNIIHPSVNFYSKKFPPSTLSKIWNKNSFENIFYEKKKEKKEFRLSCKESKWKFAIDPLLFF